LSDYVLLYFVRFLDLYHGNYMTVRNRRKDVSLVVEQISNNVTVEDIDDHLVFQYDNNYLS